MSCAAKQRTCNVLRQVRTSPSATATKALRLRVSASMFSLSQTLRIRVKSEAAGGGVKRKSLASGLSGRNTGAYLFTMDLSGISLPKKQWKVDAQVIANADDWPDQRLLLFL